MFDELFNDYLDACETNEEEFEPTAIDAFKMGRKAFLYAKKVGVEIQDFRCQWRNCMADINFPILGNFKFNDETQKWDFNRYSSAPRA